MNTKTKNKIMLVAILMIAIICCATYVSAYSVGFSLSSSSKLKAGDEVKVTVRMSNVDAGNGIDAIVAQLDYDTNVFEEVATSNLVGANNWVVNIYNSQTKKFTLTKSTKSNAAEDLLTITLKAKSAVNVNSTTVSVKNVTASGGAVSDGGTGDITIADSSVIISGTATNITTPTTNTTNKANTTTTTKVNKLPQTGENTAMIVAVVAIVAVIGILCYARYRNIDK